MSLPVASFTQGFDGFLKTADLKMTGDGAFDVGRGADQQCFRSEQGLDKGDCARATPKPERLMIVGLAKAPGSRFLLVYPIFNLAVVQVGHEQAAEIEPQVGFVFAAGDYQRDVVAFEAALVLLLGPGSQEHIRGVVEFRFIDASDPAVSPGNVRLFRFLGGRVAHDTVVAGQPVFVGRYLSACFEVIGGYRGSGKRAHSAEQRNSQFHQSQSPSRGCTRANPPAKVEWRVAA